VASPNPPVIRRSILCGIALTLLVVIVAVLIADVIPPRAVTRSAGNRGADRPSFSSNWKATG
jgi:hypothetical protein